MMHNSKTDGAWRKCRRGTFGWEYVTISWGIQAGGPLLFILCNKWAIRAGRSKSIAALKFLLYIVTAGPRYRSIFGTILQVGAIESEFRVFTMELLAGEPQTTTEVLQHGLRFHLDFAQVLLTPSIFR
jgi:hypothetical protein